MSNHGPLGNTLVYDSRTALFLMELKEAISRHHYMVIEREKNSEFLARHGMSPKEREEVLLSLRVDDFCSGPEMDAEYPGEVGVWEFMTKCRGIAICIKLRLLPSGGGLYVKCFSFHE